VSLWTLFILTVGFILFLTYAAGAFFMLLAWVLALGAVAAALYLFIKKAP
jgi:hypothetical protein